MKKILPLALSALLILPVAGCTNSQPDTSPYFFAMAADAAYIIPSKIREEKENACYALYGETRTLLNELDASISATTETSITRFNEAAAGEKVELEKYAYDVFSLAQSIYEFTDGYYNPAVYYSVIAYGFGGSAKLPTTAADLPSDEVIAKYNVLANAFGDCVLSEENGKYYAVKPQTTVEIDGVTYSLKIDLGGIGKGYAVDLADELMKKYEINYGYFTFGSSSIAFRKFYGEPDNYILGLNNPRYKEGSSLQYAQTNVKDECVSTSGDNVQYYEIGGVRYSHIIDPTTGKPVRTGIASATVIGGSAAMNDALSTAIMAMGKERAVQFINEKLSDRKVIFTFEGANGYEIISNVPADELEILDDGYKLANTITDGKIILLEN